LEAIRVTEAGLIPPHNLDAEASVLGSVLLDNERLHDLEGVRSDVFYKEANRKIFAAYEHLVAQNIPIDTVTLVDELRTRGQLDEVGGVAYIVGLSDSVPTSVYAKYYAGIVQEKSSYREIIRESTRAVQRAYDEAATPSEIAAELAEAAVRIADTGTADSVAESEAAVLDALTFMDDVRSGVTQPAERTGFMDLDALITGFRPGTLNIIAARPSQGKTAFSMNIAENFAQRSKRVVVFSLEMPKRDITLRRIASIARVDLERLLNGDMNERDVERINTKVQLLAAAPFVIDDRSEMTIQELRARATRLHRETPIDLIVVDYLQLLSSGVDTKRNEENENRDIGKISRGLKALARALNIPVIALSQLSRYVDQRPNKRPMLSDLRGSGSLEQDADLVAFLYRDEYYNSSSEKQGIAEVLVRKHRNGRVGEVELQFHKQHVRFNDLERK
jgi:replicative DNA helicase